MNFFALFPTFFRISSFVFGRTKKFIQIRNYLKKIFLATERMMLTKNRYFVGSAVQLLPQHAETTNLFDHLSRHHSVLYAECKVRFDSRPKQKTIWDAFASVTPYKKGSKRHKSMTDMITFHLVKDMVTINTVTNPGFANMIRSLDKSYVCYTITYLFFSSCHPRTVRQMHGHKWKLSYHKLNIIQRQWTCGPAEQRSPT